MSDQPIEQPSVWLVRAGLGARDAAAFERTATIGVALPPVSDLAKTDRLEARNAIVSALQANSKSEPKAMHFGRDVGYAVMLLRFACEMCHLDRVMTPNAAAGDFMCGVITSDYRLERDPPVPGYYHVRDVDWIGKVSKDEIPARTLATLRAPLAVYRPGAQPVLSDLVVWR